MTEKNTAEIDVGALRHNFTCLCDRIHKVSKDTQPMCVVKADAYGHSVEICAPALAEAGARHFAVSSIEEAEQLYSVLAQCGRPAETILILGYTPAEDENVLLLVKHNITQAVYSFEYAKRLSEIYEGLTGNGMLSESDRLCCHIKLDSGMNRLGFDTHESAAEQSVTDICETARLCGIAVTGVFSHFACADEPSSPLTEQQFARYMRVIDGCENNGLHFACKHICNSAGALRCPQMYQNMVRLGIVLYGLSPSDEVADSELIPVMRLKSRIAHIHTLHKGDFVSYGAEYCAGGEMQIATVPIGYADGFIRGYKNGGTVVVNGTAVPILGRICMDQCMVDVTGLSAKVDDEVYIFDASGENIARLCHAAGTINYEAICLVSKRVRRVAINN